MKKQLTVALGLAVLATPAFATKARLQSLGEDVNGSFYFDDNRNIWFNAAHINNHKDLVTFEWGAANGADSVDAPRAEGGIYREAGNLTWGVQFGANSTDSNAIRAAGGDDVGLEDNNLDVFVGGDTGMKWGAGIGYTSSGKDETASNAKQSALRVRLGAIMGDTQAYVNADLTNESKNADNKYEGDPSYNLGVVHNWNNYSLFADYRSVSGEGKIGSEKNDLSSSQLQVGAGRVSRLNDKASLFTKASLVWNKAENDANEGEDLDGDTGSVYNYEEYSSMKLPVVVGLETEATSWLTLRASVGQTILGSEEGKDNKRGLASTTFVNAGASLKFGELTVDGVIGNNDGTQVGDASTADGAGTLRSDVLMTRVGMTYRF